MLPAEKVYYFVFRFLVIVMGALTLYALANREWTNVFVILQALTISCTPYLLERRFSIHTPYLLRTCFVIFMFSTLVLGEIADLYNMFWWWDAVLHTVSSAGITIIGFVLLTIIYREKDLKSSPLLTSFLAFSFAMSLAVLWEVYEFCIDLFFETNTPMQPSNTDTMADLIVAILGSLVVCISGYQYVKRRSANTIVAAVIEEGKVNNQALSSS